MNRVEIELDRAFNALRRRFSRALRFNDRGGYAIAHIERGDDVAERSQRSESIGAERSQTWDGFLKRRQNFDPLDRVDAEIGVESHLEVEHLERVAGLVGDDLQQQIAEIGIDHGSKVDGRT